MLPLMTMKLDTEPFFKHMHMPHFPLLYFDCSYLFQIAYLRDLVMKTRGQVGITELNERKNFILGMNMEVLMTLLEYAVLAFLTTVVGVQLLGHFKKS